MKTIKVEVTRAFCLAGERQEVGAVLDVTPTFARELAYNGKAAPVEAEKLAKPAKAEKKA